jgi:serine/threonine protein kinase
VLHNGVKFFTYAYVSALEHAHTNGVAHGDVKPENVCIGFDGHVRLADWNSCTLRHKLKAVVPITKQPCGTWKYSPPENCWQHDVNGVGNATMEWDANASDMWNVGVLTYTCFTGCELFSTGCLSDPFLAHYIKATEQVEDADELIDSIVSHNVAPNNGKDAFLQQQNKGIDRMKTHAPFRWPPKMRPIMRDFIRSLLCVKPTERRSVEEAIQHPWIQGLVSDDIPNEIPTPDIFDFDGMNDNNINHVSSSHEFALYRHIDEDEDPI